MQMTKIDSIERKIRDTNVRVMFIEPFIEKMGNPREYEYRGECHDLGRVSGYCVCGHPIRYEFLVHHKTGDRVAILGSECIGHFRFIAPELYADLTAAVEKLEKELAEAKKAAKNAKISAKIDEIKPQYDAAYLKLRDIYTAYAAKRSWKNPCPIPYVLWKTWGILRENAPEFERKSAYVAWYERNTKKIEKLIAEFGKA
jgi:hypothetical protein